jgi:hypothetical protein
MNEKFLSGLLTMSLLMSTIMIGAFIETIHTVDAFSSNVVTADWVYDEAYKDELAHPFNYITHDEYGTYDYSDRYYEGFIEACISVEGNNEEDSHYAAET